MLHAALRCESDLNEASVAHQHGDQNHETAQGLWHLAALTAQHLKSCGMLHAALRCESDLNAEGQSESDYKHLQTGDNHGDPNAKPNKVRSASPWRRWCSACTARKCSMFLVEASSRTVRMTAKAHSIDSCPCLFESSRLPEKFQQSLRVPIARLWVKRCALHIRSLDHCGR